MAGSTANSVGNNIYTDLIMTRYPELLDERSGGKLNANMLRWTNLKDYNMAEHVNALQDSIMAIQRMIGEMAQMPSNPKDAGGNPITDPVALQNLAKTNTVNDRISFLETFDWAAVFDKRYGGPTWTFDENEIVNPTIQQHRHLGSASGIIGMPEKIVLTEEVQGKLPKANVDLSKTTTGITGADIFVESSSNTKISEAINQTVSEITGGTIQSDATLTVLGKTNTRSTREFDSFDSPVSSVQDTKTLLNRAAESETTAAQTLLQNDLNGMYYGRYVAIARLSCESLLSSGVAEIAIIKQSDGSVVTSTTINGSDFTAANTYKNFYLVFNYNEPVRLRIRKLSTTSSAKIRFDYAIVEPVHPAVFDK